MASAFRHLVCAAVVAVVCPTAAQAYEPSYDIYAKPGELIEVAPGRKMNLRCSGAGDVAIILEAGLGFASYSWRRVQPALARVTRVCSYDRAGLGFSDPGPLPRTAGAIADDLKTLLDKAGVRPPYLLVASSMGSQPARLFAFRHRENVVGMVFVDPYVEGQDAALAEIDPTFATGAARERQTWRRCLALLDEKAMDTATALDKDCIDGPIPNLSPETSAIIQQQRLRPDTIRAVASEDESLVGTNETQIRDETHPLDGMPIMVLMAANDFADDHHTDQQRQALIGKLRELHRKIAALSSVGVETLVPNSGHVIQADQPKAVIDAAVAMLKSWRESVARSTPTLVDKAPYKFPFDNRAQWLDFIAKGDGGAVAANEYAALFGDADYERFRSGARSTTWRIKYRNQGLLIDGIMVEPRTPGSHPVVIYNHGGVMQWGHLILPELLEFNRLAEKGYLVLASSYRGEGQSEGGPSMDGGDVSDSLALIALADQFPQADRTRIGMWGISRGGRVTYDALTRTTRIKAAVVVGAPSDLAGAPRRAEFDEFVYPFVITDYTSDKQRALEALSPLNWPDRLSPRTPILILHGDADKQVPVSESIRMAERLRHLRRPYALKIVKGGSHDLLADALEVRRRIEDWLDRHLLKQ